MLTKTTPAAKHIVAHKQKKTITNPIGQLKPPPLKSQLTDWCDKEFIQTSLKIKDGALKNWRKKNVITWSTLNNNIFYYKPSFIKELEDNRRGKM